MSQNHFQIMEENSVENHKKSDDYEEEEPDYSGVGACHPANNCHRYFFLIFMCSLGIGMSFKIHFLFAFEANKYKEYPNN